MQFVPFHPHFFLQPFEELLLSEIFWSLFLLNSLAFIFLLFCFYPVSIL